VLRSLVGRRSYDVITADPPESDLIAGKEPFRDAREFCCNGVRELRVVRHLDASQDEVDDPVALIYLDQAGRASDRHCPFESGGLGQYPVGRKPDRLRQDVGARYLSSAVLGTAVCTSRHHPSSSVASVP